MVNLFVYGTLMFPEIVEQITGETFLAEKAVLKSYKRFCVRGFDYPAVARKKDEVVDGFLLKNLDEEALEKIVHYEGGQYKAEKTRVFVGAESREALVFVWNDSESVLEDKKWETNLDHSKI